MKMPQFNYKQRDSLIKTTVQHYSSYKMAPESATSNIRGENVQQEEEDIC
jgi:hypothetical protein